MDALETNGLKFQLLRKHSVITCNTIFWGMATTSEILCFMVLKSLKLGPFSLFFSQNKLEMLFILSSAVNTKVAFVLGVRLIKHEYLMLLNF